MDSIENVEVLGRAIEKLLDEKRKREAAGDSFIEDDDDHLLLSTFISQLETSPKSKRKTYETTKGEAGKYETPDSSPSKDESHLEKSIEEIAEDIKKMKRQNTITQVLLSAMILLTLTWQLSEYSLIINVKERLSHPIKSIGGLLSGMFKGKMRPIKNQLHGDSTSEELDNLNNGDNGTNNGAHLQMPEVLQEFGFNNDED